MANRYWVGGTGTWTTTTTNWSATSGGTAGASAPTAADAVFFDQAATYTVTMTGALLCLDITVSAGTVTFTSTGTLAVSGSMSLLAGTLWSATGTITFNATTSKTITTNAVTINSPITFAGVGGTWTLGSNLTLGLTLTTTLTSGTLALGTFTLSTGIFSSNNATTRSISFGTGTINLTHTTATTTVLSMATATGFTYTGTGGFTTAATVARAVFFGSTAGGTSANAPNMTVTGTGTSVISFATGSWFNTLSFTSTVFNPGTTALNLNGLILSPSGTFTSLTVSMVGTGTITSNGNTIAALTINSTSGTSTTTLGDALTTGVTSTTTLTTGTLNLNGFNLTTGIFSSSNVNTRAISFGTGNIVLAHTTAATTVLSMSIATGFTYTGTGGFTSAMSVTRTFVFGTTGGSATNSPNLSLPSGAAIPTLTTGSWFNTLNFNGSTCTPAITALNLNGLTLASGGTYTNLTPTMVGTGTITSNGNTTLGPLVINNGAGTTTLAAALSCTTFTMTAGTINFATFNLTCSAGATYTAGTLSNIGTISCTTFTVSGTFTLTQGTITPSVSFVLTSGAFNYNGGTLSAVPTFTHTAGTATLGQNLALTTTGTYTLTAGTLNLNGFNLTTGIFDSSNSNTRSIAFGTGNIALTHTTAGTTVLSMATVTGFTYTGTGGFTSAMSMTRTFTFGTTGGSATNAPNLSLTSGASIPTLTTGSWFNTLNFTGSTCTPGPTAFNLNNLTLASGGNYINISPTMVGTGTITSNTNTTLVSLTIASTSGTTTLGGDFSLAGIGTIILTSGTLALAGFTLTTGAFVSSNATTRSISFSTGNIVLAFSTAGTAVLQMAIVTGFTVSGTGGFQTNALVTRTLTFGTTGGSTTNSPNLTVTGSNTAILTFTTGSWFNSLSFGTTVFNPGTTTLNLNGLTLSPSGTFTSLTATMVGTGTITSNGNTTLGPLNINNGAGTTTLAAALSCTTYTQTAGTINFATFNLTCSSGVLYYAGTLSNIGTITCTTWTCSGTFTLSSGTITPSTSFVVTGAFNYNGGTLSAVPTFTQNTAGTVTLSQAYALTSSGTYTLTAGTLTLNGFDLTTGIFSSSGSGVRSIVFGSNNIILAHTTAAQTVLAMAIVTNFTYTGAGGFRADATITRTMTFGTTGGSATNSPNLTVTGSGGFQPTLTTGSWFNKLDFSSTVFTLATTSLNLNSLTLSTNTSSLYINLTATMVGTGTITSNGNIFNALNIASTLGTTTLADNIGQVNAVTLTSGTLALANFTLTTSIFSSSNANTRSITFGTGTIILLNFNSSNITILSMANATGFTCDNTSAGGFVIASYNTGFVETVVFGTTAGSTTNAPNLTINNAVSGGGSLYINITDGSWFNTLTSTQTNKYINSIFSGATTQVLGTYVNTLALSTVNQYAGFLPNFTRTQTFTTTSGQYFAGIGFNLTGGTLTLIDSGRIFQSYNTTTLALVAGTIDVTNAANSYNSSINNQLGFGRIISSNSNTRSINFGSNTIELGGSITPIVSMAITTGFTSTGAGGLIVGPFNATTIIMGTTGGSSTNSCNVWVNWMSGYALTITTNSWFKTLSFAAINNNSSFGGTIGTTTVNCSSLEMAGTLSSLNVNVYGTGTITPDYFSNTLAGLTINSSATTLTNSVANPVPGLNCTTYTQTAGTFDFSTLNLTCSSNATYTSGTLLNIGTINCIQFIVNGNFTLTQGTIIPNATTGSFVVTNGASFNYNGGILSAPTFTQTSGTVTLGRQLALISNNSVYTLTSGTLNLNGFDLICGVFSSSGTGVRSIEFSNNNIIFSSNATFNTTVLSMADASNFTYTGTGAFTRNMTTSPCTFVFGTIGGTASNAPNLSLLSGSVTVTLTDGSWFKTLDFTGSGLNVVASATLLGINVDTLILTSNGNYTSLIPVFTRSQTWIPQYRKQLGGIGFNVPGGTFTLGGAQTYTATSVTILTAGTLNLNGFDLTTGIFSSNNSNTRSITFGSNNIVLATPTASQTVLSMANATGFSYTGTGGFQTDAAVTRTLTFGTTGGSATNSPNLTLTDSGTAVQTFTTSSWFNTLNFGTTAFNLGTTALSIAGDLTLSSGGTFTGLTATMVDTSTITSNTKAIAALTVNSTSGTTTLGDLLQFATATATTTLTAGTLNLNGFDLTTGIFSSNNSNTRSISFGTGNIVLAHTTAAQTVLSMATATGFTYTGTGGFQAAANITRTYTFGTIGGGATNSPNLTLTDSGTAIQTFTTNSWFNNFSFGTTAFNPGTTALSIAGNLTLSSTVGSVYTGLSITMVGTGNITSNSKTIAELNINNNTGTTTLVGNLSFAATTATTTLTSGTLNLNGFDLTTGIFNSTNSNTRSISFGTGNIVLAHTTAATTVLSMATATGFTYTGTGGFQAAANITRTYTFGITGGSATNSPTLSLTGSGTAIQTFTTNSWFNTINFGTTVFAVPATTLNLNSLTLNAGGTFTGLTATMVGTGNITSNSKTIAELNINNNTGTTTLVGNLSFAATTATTTLTSGTLALDTYTLTTGIFNSTNSNTRSISFGTGNIVLAHTTAATTVLSMATATGFTYTGTGGFQAAANITRTYTFGTTGGSATNSPTLSLTGSGTAIQTFTTNSWFNTINFGTTVFAVPATTLNLNSLTLNAGGTFTGLTATMVGTGNITSNSKTIAELNINNNTGTTTLVGNLSFAATTATTTLTSGTLALDTYTLTTGIFSSSNSNTRSISFGTGNIVLAHTTAATTVLSMATATGFTYTGTGGFQAAANITRTYTFGTTGGSATNSPTLSLTGSGTAIQTFTTNSWFNTLDFGTTAFTLAVTALHLNSLILSIGAGVYTNLVPTMAGTGTLNTNGKNLTTLTINHAGTTTLTTAVTTTTSTTLTSGTLALAGFTLTPTQFISGTAATRTISGAGTGIISLANNWTVSDGTGFTGSDYTINMTKATAKTFAGASGSYGTLVQDGAGALTISGSNTFADIQATTRPSTITFVAGSAQTVNNFTVSGTAGNLVTLNSTISGTQFTLLKSNGSIVPNYLSVQDSNALGGALWDLFTSGTNTILTNISGWRTTLLIVNANFLAFFF